MGKMGFFTDTTICIGCKACEVACKQWNQLPADGFRFTGHSYDNTSMLSATTWRHVAFIEQPRTTDGTGKSVNWLMMSDVCKHCAAAPCRASCGLTAPSRRPRPRRRWATGCCTARPPRREE